MSRNKRRAAAIAATALAALVGSTSVTPAAGAPAMAAEATASGSGLHGDFNGDGYRDLAASAPDAVIDGQSGAGAVTVAYGSPDGAGATEAGRTTLSQSSTGVPGVPEAGDRFGADLAVGDFDGDGYADLAVGTSGEDVSGDNDAGLVQIVWGSAGGLSGAATLTEPGRFDHDAHGRALAAGDFDGDGRTDLATGNSSAQAWLYAGGMTASGDTGGTHPLGYLNTYGFEVDALTSGDLTGDGADDLLVGHSMLYVSGAADGTLGLEAYGGVGGEFDYASVFADFNGDDYGDLVLARRGDGGGEYTVYHGAPESGSDPSWRLDWDRRYTIDQHQFGIPGEADGYDRFASALAVGDIDGDGYDDLAVGDPREDVDPVADTGFVLVQHGSSGGLTNRRHVFHQDTDGVPGVNETGDDFGSRLLFSDVNGDGKADLTIAAGNENGGNGALVVLPSSGEEITTTGARALTATRFGLPTAGQPHIGDSIG